MGDGSAEQILRSIANGTYRDFDRDPKSTHESVLVAAHKQRMAGLLERFNGILGGDNGVMAKVLDGDSDGEVRANYGGVKVTISRRLGEVQADLTDTFTGANMWFYNEFRDRPKHTMHKLVVDKEANPEAMLIYLEDGIAAHSKEKLRGFTPV